MKWTRFCLAAMVWTLLSLQGFVMPAKAGILRSPPSRIVSLAPVATEFLFALSLKDNIVGVTTYCDRPVEAKRISKVGGFADPQLEAIIKLRPTLVVATPFGNAKAVVGTLSARGIPTLSQPVESLAEMRSFLTELGKVTHHEEEAQTLQATFDTQLASLKDSLLPTSKKKLKVLLLISASPLIAAGPRTFMGEVLTHLGAENAVSSNASQWPVLSLEALLKAPPDVVVLTEGEKAIVQTRARLKPLLDRFPSQVRIFAPKDAFLQRPGLYLPNDARVLLDGLKAPHA